MRGAVGVHTEHWARSWPQRALAQSSASPLKTGSRSRWNLVRTAVGPQKIGLVLEFSHTLFQRTRKDPVQEGTQSPESKTHFYWETCF